MACTCCTEKGDGAEVKHAPADDGAVKLEIKAIPSEGASREGEVALGGRCVESDGDMSAMRRKLDELLSAEPLSFGAGSEQLTPEGKTTAEKVAAILRAYPRVPVKITACTEKPPETGHGLKVRFYADKPREPSELPLKRARSLRELLKMAGSTNPMAAQGTYDVGDSCALAPVHGDEVAKIEAAVEESLKNVEVSFVRKPAGMRIAHSKPLEVWTISTGGHAAELGVQRGWRILSIGDKPTDDLQWEDGIALMLQSLDSLPTT